MRLQFFVPLEQFRKIYPRGVAVGLFKIILFCLFTILVGERLKNAYFQTITDVSENGTCTQYDILRMCLDEVLRGRVCSAFPRRKNPWNKNMSFDFSQKLAYSVLVAYFTPDCFAYIKRNRFFFSVAFPQFFQFFLRESIEKYNIYRREW